MKKLFFLLLVFYSQTIYAQSNCAQDSILYLIAYNYIVSDSINKGETIVVSDSIIDLDRYWYSAELDDLPEEKKVLNQYRKGKNFMWFSTYYSPCLNKLFHPKSDAFTDKVIFFSQLEDNMLIVDLLSYTRRCNMFSYNEMAFQNVGRTYLFVFCKDKTLKAVVSREMFYE